MSEPTERFSSRVSNYVKYRPSYPPEIVGLLATECGLTSASRIADVGSGTGLLTELFLSNGNPVFGIEPNDNMRVAGERLLDAYPNFTSVAGTAEATMLPDQSADFVTAGQAFHWFDQRRARAEWARVLAPGGWVVLVWNERSDSSTPFLKAYDQLLRTYAADYEATNHRQVDQSVIAAFFAPGEYALRSFSNTQIFDFEGVQGRLMSSSYAPEAGHPNHQPMIDALTTLFQQHQVDGKVSFVYETKVYYGQLDRRG